MRHQRNVKIGTYTNQYALSKNLHKYIDNDLISLIIHVICQTGQGDIRET